MILYSDALAWALVHFGWQAAVIAFVYKYAIRDRAGVSAAKQYNFALAALLTMAVGFVDIGLRVLPGHATRVARFSRYHSDTRSS